MTLTLIRETASEFLISTLPNALGAERFLLEALQSRSCSLRLRTSGWVFVQGRRAFLPSCGKPWTQTVGVEGRCSAIGRLVDVGVISTDEAGRCDSSMKNDANLARHAFGTDYGLKLVSEH